MFTRRTSVFALAAIATLALAASTDAEASPFCHSFGSFSRAYFPAAPQQRIVSAKPRFEVTRTAKRNLPEAAVTKTARAHPKEVETPANQPPQLAGAATVAPVSTPATAATATCLTKEYLDT